MWMYIIVVASSLEFLTFFFSYSMTRLKSILKKITQLDY